MITNDGALQVGVSMGIGMEFGGVRVASLRGGKLKQVIVCDILLFSFSFASLAMHTLCTYTEAPNVVFQCKDFKIRRDC